MSARRLARSAARPKPTLAIVHLPCIDGGIPRVLALGACVELWVSRDQIGHDHPLLVPTYRLCRNRYRLARQSWMAAIGVEWPHYATLLPVGAIERRGVWTLEETTAPLTSIGCTLADLPQLQHEARALHKAALDA